MMRNLLRKASLCAAGLAALFALESCNPIEKSVRVADVQLEKKAITLTVGETFTLKATIAPNNATDKRVSWTSDDKTIATVDPIEGEKKEITASVKLTGVAVGTTTVTVTTTDGRKSDKCTVTVTGKSTDIHVESVEVEPEKAALLTGETITLKATVKPEGASNKSITWSSDAHSVATVDPATGEVTAVAKGTATITATTADGGKTDKCIVTVTTPENINDLSNSYIVRPGSGIIFPVKQAYDGWAGYMGKPLSGDAALTCELLWMDTPGGLSNTSSIRSVSMHKASDGENAGIQVVAGAAEGNALIALKANETIVWSWHIWVTNYDPSSTDGQCAIGDYILMNRNLGAISKTPGNKNSFGLAYQWGRKDPFPGSDGSRSPSPSIPTRYREIYDSSGTLVPEVTVGTPPYEEEIDGIGYAINNPAMFIMSTGNQQYVFWTSKSMSLNPGTLRGDLWGGGGNSGQREAKSVFDPCPTGWRVPHDPEISTKLGEKGATVAVTPNVGIDLQEYGFFPFSGMLAADGIYGGRWMETTYSSCIWYDWPGGFGGRMLAFTESKGVGTSVDASFRSYGLNVRCEKEKK